MRQAFILVLWVCILSCNDKKKSLTNDAPITENRIHSPELQSILEAEKVKGAILIYDSQKNTYYSNDFDWSSTGKLPASTYKIPNSIIALETGEVENESTLFKWDGNERALKVWEQDLVFKQAFQSSCVPCYQDIARRIGSERMNKYLSTFGYGEMKVDSTNIDSFWLLGKSRINQFQQIDFLNRFYNKKLPIAERTYSIMKKVLVIEENNSNTLSGKTGWSISNGLNNGWFVGYIESEAGTYFFASNLEPKDGFDRDLFISARKKVTLNALRQLRLID